LIGAHHRRITEESDGLLQRVIIATLPMFLHRNCTCFWTRAMMSASIGVG